MLRHAAPSFYRNGIWRQEFCILVFIFVLMNTVWWLHYDYVNVKQHRNLHHGTERYSRWTFNLIEETVKTRRGLNDRYGDLDVDAEVSITNRLFRPKLTLEGYDELLDLIEMFVSMCGNTSIPWFLIDRSLLGAIRHFGLIPWDDEVDVLVDVQDQDKLRHVLSSLNNASYSFTEYKPFLWKFSKLSKPPNFPFSKPIINIEFYDYEQNHSVVSRKHSTHLSYVTDDLFPVKLLPFEEFLLPTPKNAIKILDHEMKGWNHSCVFKTNHEKSAKYFTMDCEELYDFYPFVFRDEVAGRVETTLKFRGKTLHQNVV